MRTVVVRLLALSAVLVGAGAVAPVHASVPPTAATRAASMPSASRPCGVRAHAPSRFDHVVWVVLENKSRSSVIGSPSAPYLTSLAHRCGNAAGMVAKAHPSLPNYLSMTSGRGHGVTDDRPPSAHAVRGRSIFSIVKRWRALEEGMPSRCRRTDSGRYAVRHNPAAYYTRVRSACARRDVPLRSTPDLRARFTMVEPDLCHSMHDCSVATGDAWARRILTTVLDSPQYTAGRTAVFVTFDENDGSPGNQIPTIVVTPSVKPGTVVRTRVSHCALLRTTLRMLQNPGPYTYAGCAARAESMRPAFNS